MRVSLIMKIMVFGEEEGVLRLDIHLKNDVREVFGKEKKFVRCL